MTALAGQSSRTQPSLPLAGAVVVLAAATGALVGIDPSLVVPLGLVAAVVALAVVSVEVATLSVIFLLFLNVPGVIASRGAPVIVAAAVPLLLGIPLLAMLRRGERIVITPTFVSMLALLLIASLSAVLSRYPAVAFEQVQTLLFEGVLLYFLLVNVIRSAATLRRALWALIAAGACLALVTIAQAITQTYYNSYRGFAQPDPSFLVGKGEPRATGPVGDPNYYGQLLLVVAAIALVFTWRGATLLHRLVAGGATAVILYAIALTYSRGAAVALLALLVVMALMRYFKAWQLLAVVAAVVTLVIAVPSYGERLASLTTVTSAGMATGSEPETDEAAQGRSTEMRAAVAAFLDHPVLGVGPAVFPLYYREYAQQVGGYVHDGTPAGPNKGQEAQREAHNMFIAQAADLGLAGFLAFSGAVALTITALVRARATNLRLGRHANADVAAALLLAVVGYLLAGVFLTLAYESYFWLLLGLAGAATSVTRREP